jgi:hypothetical protein
MPQRIQRRRVKGWRLPANAVSVTRPGRYGNPFKVGDVNRDSGEIVTLEKCLEYFEFYLHRKYPGDALREFLEPLRGKDLACFCPEGEPCHGDTLLRLANA